MSVSDRKEVLRKNAALASEGSREAVNSIMKTYTGEMYFVTRMFIGDRETARSAVQASMRTVLENIRACAEAEDPEAWIRRCVEKEALDLILPLKIDVKESGYQGSDEKADPHAEAPYDDEDTRVGILHVMDTLDVPCRTAAALHFFEHQSIRKTAETLSVTEEETKALLTKTKNAIRKEMPLGTFIAYMEKLNPGKTDGSTGAAPAPAVQEYKESGKEIMSTNKRRKINIPRLALVIMIGLLLIFGLFKLISGLFSGGKKEPASTPTPTPAEVSPTPETDVSPSPEVTPDGSGEATPDSGAKETSPSPDAASPSPDAAVTPTPETSPSPDAGKEESSVSQTGTLVVKIGNLRVRSGAGTSYPILRMAENNKSYRVYETKKSGGYTWYRIGDNEWVADNGSWVTFRADR